MPGSHPVTRTCVRAVVIGALLLSVVASVAEPAMGHARRMKVHHHRSSSRGALGHPRSRTAAEPAATPQPLVFGIYAGGPAGTVGPGAPVIPEDPAAQLQALQALRPPGRPFVLHLYVSYSGSTGPSAAQQIGAQLAAYTAAGLECELVVRYQPADLDSAADVSGFASFVRTTVDQLGSNPSLVGLQVTNEANIGGHPNASDGYYPGARDALIQGVIAAKQQSQRDGFNQLQIGFNWAYSLDGQEQSFWQYLGQHGGQVFAAAVDWVGIDAYPGTWGPALAAGKPLAESVPGATGQALQALRAIYMPLAHLPASVPIHFCESGYPTGPGRSYATQATVLGALVQAVENVRAKFNVTDYRWFDLRDANTASSSFEDQYGLMTDSYQPKPAFSLYRSLVAALA